MKYFYIILSVIGLAMVLVPSLLLFFDAIEALQMKNYMLIGTLLWFSGAIPWLGKKKLQN
jgi:hypothetical protein